MVRYRKKVQKKMKDIAELSFTDKREIERKVMNKFSALLFISLLALFLVEVVLFFLVAVYN